MKKIIASLLLMSSAISMNAAVNVNRIEPTDWYVGMKDASLQLMVYGKDIKNADVMVDYPGVKVDSIARLDSPNYLLVYLNLDGAKAGEMTLNFFFQAEDGIRDIIAGDWSSDVCSSDLAHRFL